MPNTFQSPLDRIKVQGNVEDRLRALEAALQKQQTQNVKFASASDAAADAGLFQVGNYQSGTGSLEGGDLTGTAMVWPGVVINGVTYTLVGMNNGYLEFGLSAVDGTATAGAGAVILSREGIEIPDAGDAITFDDTPNLGHAFLSYINSNAQLTTYNVTTETNQVTNGDFETGSFSSWTVTHAAGGTSSVVSGQGYNSTYAMYLKADLSLGNGDTISQAISAVTSGVVISFKMKVISSGLVGLVVSDNGTNTVVVPSNATDWRTFYVILYGSVSAVAFRLSSHTPPAEVYVDNIVVRPLNGSSTAPGAYTLSVGSICQVQGNEFRVRGAADNLIYFDAKMAPTKQITLNSSAASIDTIVFGATDLNLIHANASTDRVGIGIAAPAYKLDVVGDVNVSSGSVYRINGVTVLSGTGPQAETNANDIFRCDSPGGTSAWTGTFVAAGSSGTTIKATTVSGTAASMVPTSTSQLAKMVLYNTTRSNSVLITNCVTGTPNTITSTATFPANWVNGDALTIASQTVSGGGVSWVDLQLTSGPLGKVNIFMKDQVISANVGDAFRIHPLTTFSSSKVDVAIALVANQGTNGFGLISVTSAGLFSVSWTGSPTTVLLREAGYLS